MKKIIAAALLLGALSAHAETHFRVLGSSIIFNSPTMGAQLPCVAKAANGDLLVQFNSGKDQWPGSKAYLVRSTDGGVTWGVPQLIIESTIPVAEGGSIHTNIGMTVLSNGDIIIPFTHGVLKDGWQGGGHTGQKWVRTYAIISHDHGYTWGPWIPAFSMEGQQSSAFGRIVEMPNGDLWYPMWAFYSWASSANFPSAAHSGYIISGDQGQTWGGFGGFQELGPYGETSIIHLGDGGRTMLAAGKRNGSAQITRIARSDNDGFSWTELPTNVGGKNASLHLSPSGTPLLFYSSPQGRIATSEDGGYSWDEVVQIVPPISRNGDNFSYGMSAVNLGDNKMMVVYSGMDTHKPYAGVPWLTVETYLAFTMLEETDIPQPPVPTPDPLPELASSDSSSQVEGGGDRGRKNFVRKTLGKGAHRFIKKL